MSSRFEEVDENVNDLLHEVRAEFFPELRQAKIKCLYDLKKRMSCGKIVLARIMKANDLIKCLTATDGNELDYIIMIDKVAWENVERADRIKLLRHELRHSDYDPETEKNPYKLRDHDIEDFIVEVELNSEDPRWATRVTALVETIYEQRKDDENDSEV